MMSSFDSIFWKQVVDSIYNDVLITDSKGTIIYANNSSEYWFGLKKEELIGRSVYELEKEGIFSPSVVRLVLESNKRQTVIQDTVVGKKLLLTGDLIYNKHSKIQYVVTYSQDITDFERLKTYVAEVETELQKVKNELDSLIKQNIQPSKVIASSKQMKQIINTSLMIADSDATVLITGETGVGKNVLAKFIHENSRRKGAFIEVNCGSLPESLLESELFGYIPGAFTGANPKGKKGVVEEAENGTLFLDEIGELPLELQVKLLTLIQEKKFFKIGESKPRYVDFRLIAATNINLEEKIKKKSFREDLFYRLSVIPLSIPPLRERKEDLSELILLFKNRFNQQHNKNKDFHFQTIEYLLNYSWPGNTRELSNMIERLLLTISSPSILPEHLPENVLVDNSTNLLFQVGKKSMYELLDEFELNILKKAKQNYQTTTEMAKRLGVSQPTVVRKMQKHHRHFYT
jgi:PAS domain S-box-containing protein